MQQIISVLVKERPLLPENRTNALRWYTAWQRALRCKVLVVLVEHSLSAVRWYLCENGWFIALFLKRVLHDIEVLLCVLVALWTAVKIVSLSCICYVALMYRFTKIVFRALTIIRVRCNNKQAEKKNVIVVMTAHIWGLCCIAIKCAVYEMRASHGKRKQCRTQICVSFKIGAKLLKG